ncbi:MAG: TadE/TadG family type IV pilus assembly protein [Propioniciclava sp.]
MVWRWRTEPGGPAAARPRPAAAQERLPGCEDAGHRGAIAVEFAIIIPAVVLLIGLVIGGGRLAHAQQTLQQVAASGARAASIARTAPAARADADAVIASDIADADLHCGGGLTHSIDVGGFSAQLGQPAEVSVDVGCRVALADLLLPGLPGHWRVDASATSPLDRYRSRR